MNEDLLTIVKIIRGKMNMIVFALFISTLTIAGWSITQLLIEQPYLEETDEMLERVAEDDLRLLRIVHAIRDDVLQVQQHLTDISATRGLNGLDDGFEQAEWYAKDFKENVAKALEIADLVGLTDIIPVLERASRKFDPYFEQGKKMAQLYVAEGTESGNKLMPTFDSRAAGLSLAIMDLVTQIEENASNDLLDTEESIDTLKDNNQLMLKLALLPAVFGLIAAVFGIVAIRRIVNVLSSDTQDKQ